MLRKLFLLILCSGFLWLAGCSCSSAGGSGDVDASTGGPEFDAATACAGRICPNGGLCRFDTCVPNLGTCMNNLDCPGDSYCSADGECLPYGVPADVINDPTCQRPELPGGVTPAVQCEWTGPTSGPAAARIYTAPIIADLNLDKDPNKLQPSIVVTTWAGNPRSGILRVFDGRTCNEFEGMRMGEVLEDRPGYGTQWAVGDLDGDVPAGGHPEIVGMHTTDTGTTSPIALYALKVDASGAQPVLERAWYGRDCDQVGEPLVPVGDNQANFGPGIWDLNDDTSPEILIDTLVFDADGCLLTQEESFTPYITHGRMNAVADVDLDGAPELVAGDRIAAWDIATTEWVAEPYFNYDMLTHRLGHVAIADIGQYSTLPGQPVPNELPEIIVVSAENPGSFNPSSTGTIRVQTLDGTIVFGPVELYHLNSEFGGHGGAPTASDFDGDGYVEFAAAANEFYVVYDPDCMAALGGASPAERPNGKCVRAPGMETLPDGVLWAMLSSDFSSSGTGSSIFDFNGDGRAEAVYRDECFARVYDGTSGEVLFSAVANNGTGFELPAIADVDGDFATEIVVVRADNGPACGCPDPLFENALGCEDGVYDKQNGFAILRDPEDRWASSRPIWNQHAYSITNVTDNARIPASSQVQVNWKTPGLNNFRQNTQGDLGVFDIADLTVVFDNLTDLCTGESGATSLRARVCNRGTANVQDGVDVEFVEIAASAETQVCTTVTTRLLMPGECEMVECMGMVNSPDALFVRVDPNDVIADCNPANNDGAGLAAICIEIE